MWDELLALGSDVRLEPGYSDALTVARETMRRARKTIEELIQRLLSLGFVFGYDQHLMHIVRRIQQGTTNWTDYLGSLDWVRQQPPLFLPATVMEDELIFAVRHQLTHDADVFRQERRDDPTNPPVMVDYLHELERDVGPVPLSIRAWYEEVGAVNFYGYHPRWPSMSYCDPLQICVLDQQWRAHVEMASDRSLVFFFAEDQYFKDNVSGAVTPYAFTIPDTNTDAVLFYRAAFPQGAPLTFVQYLRWSLLHWAGFPGMAEWDAFPGWPDSVTLLQDDLAVLTKDLTPF